MHSAHPGGCCSAREPATSSAVETKTATGTVFEAEFGTETGFDAEPPDRRHHPSVTGYGHP